MKNQVEASRLQVTCEKSQVSCENFGGVDNFSFIFKGIVGVKYWNFLLQRFESFEKKSMLGHLGCEESIQGFILKPDGIAVQDTKQQVGCF